MAQKVQVLLVDDVDGGTADETVTFALDGVSYEIDLTTKNAKQLRDTFGTWTGSARKVTGRSSARAARGTGAPRRSNGSTDATAIREWARSNGHNVSERGRISAEIKAAYEAAH